MNRLVIPILIFILALVLAASLASARESLRVIEGTVTKVTDGDTLQVTDDLGTRVKVRLYGIDAPERERRDKFTGATRRPGQPYGEESFLTLRQKTDRQRVRIDVLDIDKYRRLVGVVRIGERDINREMLDEGMAWAYRKYLRGEPALIYTEAEEQARGNRRGIWQQTEPVPPWLFRKAGEKRY